MRISDWSSDVCSSDLQPNRADRALEIETPLLRRRNLGKAEQATHPLEQKRDRVGQGSRYAVDAEQGKRDGRPEEHTSELQSLMRNPYAVFCSKKKKPTKVQPFYPLLHYSLRTQ